MERLGGGAQLPAFGRSETVEYGYQSRSRSGGRSAAPTSVLTHQEGGPRRVSRGYDVTAVRAMEGWTVCVSRSAKNRRFFPKPPG